MCYSFFIAIIRIALKAYFAWKQLKVDYSKLFEKNKIAGAVLFVSWLVKYKWKKINENYNAVGTGAHKVGKVVSFSSSFDPNSPDI